MPQPRRARSKLSDRFDSLTRRCLQETGNVVGDLVEITIDAEAILEAA
jgi:hypothetical protein